MPAPVPAPPSDSWIDTKDLLLQMLMAGYSTLGFGIEPTNLPATDDQHPTISFLRALGQSARPRPLITVMRLGGDVRSTWLSNIGAQVGTTGAVGQGVVPVLPLEESFRIQIEAFNDNGGISAVDWLLESAQTILLTYYDALTWPIEAGGYGMYFPAWKVNQDEERPFTEMAGKVIFSNSLTFRATRLQSIAVTPPVSGPSGFVLDFTVGSGPALEVFSASPAG